MLQMRVLLSGNDEIQSSDFSVVWKYFALHFQLPAKAKLKQSTKRFSKKLKSLIVAMAIMILNPRTYRVRPIPHPNSMKMPSPLRPCAVSQRALGRGGVGRVAVAGVRFVTTFHSFVCCLAFLR